MRQCPCAGVTSSNHLLKQPWPTPFELPVASMATIKHPFSGIQTCTEQTCIHANGTQSTLSTLMELTMAK